MIILSYFSLLSQELNVVDAELIITLWKSVRNSATLQVFNCFVPQNILHRKIHNLTFLHSHYTLDEEATEKLNILPHASLPLHLDC